MHPLRFWHITLNPNLDKNEHSAPPSPFTNGFNTEYSLMALVSHPIPSPAVGSIVIISPPCSSSFVSFFLIATNSTTGNDASWNCGCGRAARGIVLRWRRLQLDSSPCCWSCGWWLHLQVFALCSIVVWWLVCYYFWFFFAPSVVKGRDRRMGIKEVEMNVMREFWIWKQTYANGSTLSPMPPSTSLPRKSPLTPTSSHRASRKRNEQC